ncbi:MAG: nitroreductase family protein [Desulfuromonadales bacterium]|nr:nitroreductase family protein [Desulfuromonadales bacterium]MBN2793610.1 nitroreductase family protein [Desulfuromonadales bacterium]
MFELLRRRRSVRAFKQLPIEAEKIRLLSEALLRAPTSRNLQPCEFVFVDEPAILDRLVSAKAHGTGFFSTAPLAIVVAADPQISDVWIEDCSIAAIIVQLAAEELGLKSCWAQLRMRMHDDDLSASDFVRQLVGLPEGMDAPMVIAVGYPEENKAGHDEALLKKEKIHFNRYGKAVEQ